MSLSMKYATAYTGGSPISGFENIGNIAVDTEPGSGDYSLGNFVGGVSGSYDANGYIIISDTTTAGLVGKTTGGNTTGPAPANEPTFWASISKTDSSFLDLVNNLPARIGQTPFDNTTHGVVSACNWLSMNGYWTSYVAPVLSLDAGNTSSYPGTGTVWTDLVDGRQFDLLGNPSSGVPTYYSADGGKILFYAPAGHYAACTASLPTMNKFTLSIWHYWNGGNSGGQPCLISEVYPGNTNEINYLIGNLSGSLQGGYYNNSGFQMSTGFNLTANQWYHIVVTCDSSQVVKLYVNNTLIGSTQTSGSQPISSNGGIHLMRRWDNPEFWDGYLAKVDIYNKALSQSQITSIWDSTKSRFGFATASFTINTSDIANLWGTGTGITTNGLVGYTSAGNDNIIFQLVNYELTSQKLSEITNIFNTNSLGTNYEGYIFNVTWGAGSSISSGIVRVGLSSNSNQLLISAVDTAYNDWYLNNGPGNPVNPSLAGTFNFPATFTLYTPVIQSESNYWC
jgi:hypothetical protein